MAALKAAIYDTLEARNPMTDRQLFYQLIPHHGLPKLETEYKNAVVRICGLMREAGELPWEWITDSTRWRRKPNTHNSLMDALADTAQYYRRALWNEQSTYIEIWCEKDALAGVLYEVTGKWDVPLMVVKGFSSKAFIHTAAMEMAALDKPCFVYYFGDYDPSGLRGFNALMKSFRRYAPNTEITVERVAVTEEQIRQYQLPTRPTKMGSSHAKGWTGGDSVELDALPPDVLMELVTNCIEKHVDQRQYELTRLAEESERKVLDWWVRNDWLVDFAREKLNENADTEEETNHANNIEER
jgi:hypothetical protein